MNAIVIITVCIVIGAVLYLLMIMPRMAGRPDMAPFRKVLYAHRGLHDNDSGAPENSMAAFRRAVEGGYGIELDIQLTRDKIPVVFHDFTLERVCGAEGKVSDYSYEELRRFTLCGSDERIPRFEDVLQLVDGRVPLIVELKIERADVSLCPVADKLLQGYQGLYCVESFNPLGVLWYRQNRRGIVRGQLSDAFHRDTEYRGLLYFMLENLLFNGLTKPDFVAYNHKFHGALSRKLCRSLYRSTAAAWTVRSEAELSEAKKHFDLFIFDSFLPAQGSRVSVK